MSPLALALSLSLASPAQRVPVEPAIARVIDAALVYRRTQTTDWSSVARRLAPYATLHDGQPSNDDWRNHDKSVYRRSGWISESGASGSVGLCGDQEEVHAVSVSMSRLWTARNEILPELAALGVTAAEIDRQGPLMPEGADDYDRSLRAGTPDRIVWRLEKAGHDDAVLLADHVCTPPGTRSAPHCWMRFTVQLGTADPTRMECPMLGRWGV